MLRISGKITRISCMIICYLAVVVSSNLLVAKFGQLIVIPVSLILIPFDLTTRDVLHDYWHNSYLWVKMGCLIFTGSVLSFIFNSNSLQIAIASFASFAIAGLVDTLVYYLLGHHRRVVRMNVSNLFSAMADSIIFLSVAFTNFSYTLCTIQTFVKFIGGVVWIWLLVQKLQILDDFSTRKRFVVSSNQ